MSRFIRTTGLAVLLAAGGGVLAHALAGTSELDGSRWALATLGGAPAMPGVETTLDVRPGGEVGGRGGCNSYSGRLFGPPGGIVATQRGCMEPGVMEQENAFLAALDTAASYTLDGDGLTLVDGEGEALATFTAVD